MAHRARERLVRLAKKHQLSLRQSYERISKRAFIAHQRYAHAKQFKRAKRELRRLRTYLGRLERDIARKIKGDEQLIDIFRRPLYLFSSLIILPLHHLCMLALQPIISHMSLASPCRHGH